MEEFIEDILTFFNSIIPLVFIYLKYILSFILIAIGILTLLKLRGIYIQQRAKGVKDEEDQLKNTRLIVGTFYLFVAFGILFNHLIYFLIWISNPLTEGLIFVLFDIFKHAIQEQTGFNIDVFKSYIHPLFALFSFIAILHLALSCYYLINSNRTISNPRAQLISLFIAVTETVFFGFTACFPYFLN
jgi:hypothetical protein